MDLLEKCVKSFEQMLPVKYRFHIARKHNVTEKLKKKKKYYVRVRAYLETNGVKKYSKWSKIKSVKIKK